MEWSERDLVNKIPINKLKIVDCIIMCFEVVRELRERREREGKSLKSNNG